MQLRKCGAVASPLNITILTYLQSPVVKFLTNAVQWGQLLSIARSDVLVVGLRLPKCQDGLRAEALEA